jgi:hypothetical protein
MRRDMLGMPQTLRHFGTSIAAEVLDILHMFQIKEQIGYFILNKAENNIIIMKMIDGKLGFDGLIWRGRCIGHIINLAAKAVGKTLAQALTGKTDKQVYGAHEHAVWFRGVQLRIVYSILSAWEQPP